MRRTPLKRKTPLKAKVGLKRMPMKIKPKRYPVPKGELAKVDERAKGLCEFHGDVFLCIGKLVYAHINHRKMGGVQGGFARIINDHRNIAKVCVVIHDAIDGRKKYSKKLVENMIGILKYKLGWFGWYEENKGVLSR